MDAFMKAVFFGAIEAVLLFALAAALVKGKKFLFTLILLADVAGFAVAVWFVTMKYTDYVIYYICGFLVGLPVFSILMYAVVKFLVPIIKTAVVRFIKKRKLKEPRRK